MCWILLRLTWPLCTARVSRLVICMYIWVYNPYVIYLQLVSMKYAIYITEYVELQSIFSLENDSFTTSIEIWYKYLLVGYCITVYFWWLQLNFFFLHFTKIRLKLKFLLVNAWRKLSSSYSVLQFYLPKMKFNRHIHKFYLLWFGDCVFYSFASERCENNFKSDYFTNLHPEYCL